MVAKIIDRTGQVFGRLTVIDFSHKHGRKSYWNCLCECGNYTKVRSDSLTSGNVKSCKCLNNEPKYIIHGQARTKLYHVWGSMVNRCTKETDKNYHNYGGRGISIYQPWRDDYMEFYKWSHENGYKEGLSIDRIDVNGNYEPSNCKWITMKEQQLNKRTTVRLSYNNETLTIKEWAEKLNCTYNLFYGRLRKYDYDIEKAIKSLNSKNVKCND